MALTDYKIRRITKKDNGDTTVVMAIYEGAITTEKELNDDGDLVDVTRYRRTSLLRVVVKKISKNPTEAKIREHCDVELNSDSTRVSIDGQKRTVLRG